MRNIAVLAHANCSVKLFFLDAPRLSYVGEAIEAGTWGGLFGRAVSSRVVRRALNVTSLDLVLLAAPFIVEGRADLPEEFLALFLVRSLPILPHLSPLIHRRVKFNLAISFIYIYLFQSGIKS